MASNNTMPDSKFHSDVEMDIYQDDIDLYLNLYCQEHNIDNIYDIRPQQWTAALLYIYQRTFKRDNSMLKIPGGIGCAYDLNAVNALVDRYIYLCMEHNQRVSIMGFSCLSGISSSTIYDWHYGKDRAYIYLDVQGKEIPHNMISMHIQSGKRYYKKPTTTNKEIYKKLVKFEGQSLEDSLTDRKKNPMHTLPLFNAFQARHAAKQDRPQLDTGSIAESLGITAELQGIPDKKSGD